jgi:glycosyltransferase involved in cell wall biosynthesis
MQSSDQAVPDGRIPILYIAPWVDLGGSDKGTIDWFRHLDRTVYAPSLITTQPSSNRWIAQVEPYAEEVWALPELLPGSEFPEFILGFIESRGVRVVHMMNSRIGFDLMPDMTCLAEPPVIVVQLHAEEPDRSGYVRYSSSRYGNLVDAFSVTSRQLADAMTDFDVPGSRMEVILTGVDGVDEFNPDVIEPLAGLEGTGPRILWPGRLVAQKDPLLTLDVVRLLADRGLEFVLDVVGDGDMEPEVRARARALGIDQHIRWYPPSQEMPRWYRSADLLLMTSVFEGVPYVMYEALAMGVPCVVPAIPGNVELLGRDADRGGILIDPRDDAVAYADAIQELLQDAQRRTAMGADARALMLSEFTITRMARHHEELYQRLLARRPATSRRGTADDAGAGDDTHSAGDAAAPPAPAPVRFPRAPAPERSVAVVIPCYQHGRFLTEAVASVRAQTLPAARIVVVDDCSEDAETTAALDAVEADPLVTVIRLADNGGPSRARNRALAQVTESYVLPLDADDLLYPEALERMVEQIERAPEDVGFVYPNAQHFGNRNDYYEPPAYNLHLLLQNNYCAATTLFDRRVFDAGVAYPEDIVFGHEDWDIVLQMAERGIHGERAQDRTFLYRKRGFSRVNAVEYGPDSFHRRIERRHPVLYERRAEIKGRWAPALSLLLVDGADGAASGEPWPDDVLAPLARQTSLDFEVVRAGVGGAVPEGLHVADVAGEDPAARAAAAIAAARGRFVVLAGRGIVTSLRRSTFVEQVIRALWFNADLDRFVIATPQPRPGGPLAQLRETDVPGAEPAAVVWQRAPEGPSGSVTLGATATPLEDVVNAWAGRPVQWRAG